MNAFTWATIGVLPILGGQSRSFTRQVWSGAQCWVVKANIGQLGWLVRVRPYLPALNLLAGPPTTFMPRLRMQAQSYRLQNRNKSINHLTTIN